jgi:hypothetical protein
VYLKVSPMRGLRRFKIWGKLAPRYIRSFKSLEQRGEVTYQLELQPQLSEVHDIFHVSQLRKYLRVPKEHMPLEELTIGKKIVYQEYSVKILDTWKSPGTIATRCAKCSGVTIPKPKSLGKKKISWMQSFQIFYFSIRPNLEGKIHPKGVGL